MTTANFDLVGVFPETAVPGQFAIVYVRIPQRLCGLSFLEWSNSLRQGVALPEQHSSETRRRSADAQGQRAQRIEMLLLHELHQRKFLLPDKLSARERERQARRQHVLEGGDEAGFEAAHPGA